MIVNKYYITRPVVNQQIDIPLEMDLYRSGQDDSIEIFTKEAVTEVVGQPTDFEINRFSHAPYECTISNNGVTYTTTCTDINYVFSYFGGAVTNLNNSTDWVSSYTTLGFTPDEMYYNVNSYTKSFWKLDFYDIPDDKAQTNYITIILPTQQGLFEQLPLVSNGEIVSVRKPTFLLDFIGDKEGFFIYWLKNTNFLNINTFYMSAKFYDARVGGFIKFMNRPQSTLTPGLKYNFPAQDYFYYKVMLNYSDNTYKVFDQNGNRVGLRSNPINWYEYVNPQ